MFKMSTNLWALTTEINWKSIKKISKQSKEISDTKTITTVSQLEIVNLHYLTILTYKALSINKNIDL